MNNYVKTPKTIFLAYSRPSSLTAKALKHELETRGIRVFTKRARHADLLLRWGNSKNVKLGLWTEQFNCQLSQQNTVNKIVMLDTLKAAGIAIPNGTRCYERVNQYRDLKGGFYVRSRKGNAVRYDTVFNPINDLYVTKPVPFKRREYRIHVMNGAIMAMYEKVPYDTDRPRLFNSDTCAFRRVDPLRSKCGPDGQTIAINAVKALGLDYGAVDLIRTRDRAYVVCEVNSSAGLNSANVKRFVDALLKGMIP